MNTTTIEQYRTFLHSRVHVSSTVTGYTRVIAALEEPPTSNEPSALLDYVDNTIKNQKELLSNTNYKLLRASLGNFFLMRTGILINEYRKQHVSEDIYDIFLKPYKDYCQDFLHLSPVVTQASIRETKYFLKTISDDPTHVEWENITAKDVVTFLKAERSK